MNLRRPVPVPGVDKRKRCVYKNEYLSSAIRQAAPFSSFERYIHPIWMLHIEEELQQQSSFKWLKLGPQECIYNTSYIG